MSSSPVVENLIRLLDLEQIEVNLFRGFNPEKKRPRVFGGQVLGQALIAAGRTVEDREPHSFHGYFLRPGNSDLPIIYEVDRIRDGKSFTTRRVVAIQNGKAIFNMSSSFQVKEQGLEHQFDMPDAEPPEGLDTEEMQLEVLAESDPENYKPATFFDWPIEFRHINPGKSNRSEKHSPHHMCWFRATDELPDNPILHKCILAYASDRGLLSTALLPHGVSIDNKKLQPASLDHAMWFHHEVRADEWLLYVQDSPSSSSARGFCRGSIYRRDGLLVASVTQEGLIRLWD
ncbi:MAG: acyl-CoA thioesterase II [Pseudomonadales bacterium]|nr:acyl-CoA thioesterase II [Pseudomonadales bacterium]